MGEPTTEMLRHFFAQCAGLLLALLATVVPVPAAGETAARQCLNQAAVAAQSIELPGDQSAARRSLVISLAPLDPQAAWDAAAGVNRPGDAAWALGAAATGLASIDSPAARQALTIAGQLLLRVPDPTQRFAEQQLLLREVAALREGALVAAPELPPEEAHLAVVLGLSTSDPAGAMALSRSWGLKGEAADRALAAIGPQLSDSDPDAALEIAASIAHRSMREQTIWRIAERRPPAEAVTIAVRAQDAVVRADILTSAAERMAPTDPGSARAALQMVSVAPDSALAQLAVALAAADESNALELARALPQRPRAWALGRIALLLAPDKPERAELLLSEIEPQADVTRLVLAGMSLRDPDRAIRLARALPEGEERGAALAAIATAMARLSPEEARDLVWSIRPARWRSRAAEGVAGQLAHSDVDAATSLIGLVTDPDRARRLRCEIAAISAVRDPKTAERLLDSLPPSSYRNEAALAAGRALVAAGGTAEEALRLARLGTKSDLALRWLVPHFALSQAGSPTTAAERIGDPYLRALGLIDAATVMLRAGSKCRPAPDRAQQIRPIVEWESR